MATTYTNVPTGMTAAELDVMFGIVAQRGAEERQKTMATRVSAALQPQWQEFYDQNLVPPAPDPTEATVKNGDTIVVQFSGGQTMVGSPATLSVAGGVVAYARTTQPQSAMLANNDQVNVQNADGSAATGSPGAAVVAGTVLTAVKLSV